MKVSTKQLIIVIAITFGLVTAFAESLTGNVWMAPAIKDDSEYKIDKGMYLGDSKCDQVDGTVVSINHPKYVDGDKVELISIADDVVLIKVNGARRAMEYNFEKYVAGRFVTVFSVGTNQACLIIK
tara:strand:- start:534 stop:911 length:378 start_codon:yes stop_codon:yes gene_type:complete